MSSRSELLEDLALEIRESLDCFYDAGLVMDANPVKAFEHWPLFPKDLGYKNEERYHECLLSWEGAAGLSYLFDDFQNTGHYRSIINNRDFNLLLRDGSVIQIFYKTFEGQIAQHRLAFFPAPYEFLEEDLTELSFSDIIEALNENDLKTRLRLVSPIRFDYDKNKRDAFHPHSHLTLSRSTCRIPVYGPVSCAHFVRFIIFHFFQEFWHVPSVAELEPKIWKRTLDHPVSDELFLDTSLR